MDGTVRSMDPSIAADILYFLVDNDLSMQELLEALVICRKVKDNLSGQVQDELSALRDQYEASSPELMPVVEDLHKIINKRYRASPLVSPKPRPVAIKKAPLKGINPIAKKGKVPRK